MKQNKSKIKISTQERIFRIVIYLVMFFAVLICFYPFYYLVIYSLSDPDLVSKGVYLVPKGITLKTYEWIFQRSDFGNAFLVSISRTVIHTLSCGFFPVCISGYQTGYDRKEICLPLCDHYDVSGSRAGSVLYYNESVPFI